MGAGGVYAIELHFVLQSLKVPSTSIVLASFVCFYCFIGRNMMQCLQPRTDREPPLKFSETHLTIPAHFFHYIRGG